MSPRRTVWMAQAIGSMINLARLEMARDPVVWWTLTAAFVFMFGMVLSANLFAGAVRDAFDPRSRSFRPRLARAPRAAAAPAAPATAPQTP